MQPCQRCTRSAASHSQVRIQEVQDDFVSAWSVRVEVQQMARVGLQILREVLRSLIVGIGRLVVDARAPTVAHDVVSLGGDGLPYIQWLPKRRGLTQLTKAAPLNAEAS
jgi:hypothetical protein